MNQDDLQLLRRQVHQALLAPGAATSTSTDRQVDRQIDRRVVANLLTRIAPLLEPTLAERLIGEVLADVHGLGPLEPLLADHAITDIMVNGSKGVWIERNGILADTGIAISTDEVEHLIERIVAPLGLRVDRSSPIIDARLPDGSRVNAIVPPLAVDGAVLTIRRFGARAIPLEEIATPPVAELLHTAVQGHQNILISGGTGAGKTTLLNALAGRIARTERVITVEDAAELRLPLPHVVRLEGRPANSEGVGKVSLRDLVRNALRMRPDRIIVGEVRGPEALDMLQAMNTGHEGSMSTCHANTPVDALRRIETMVLMGEVALPLVAVRQQIVASIDLVVQISRTATGGRQVVDVCEVVDGEGLQVRRLATADQVVATPQRPLRRGIPVLRAVS